MRRFFCENIYTVFLKSFTPSLLAPSPCRSSPLRLVAPRPVAPRPIAHSPCHLNPLKPLLLPGFPGLFLIPWLAA
jgi:hypothetical protein